MSAAQLKTRVKDILARTLWAYDGNKLVAALRALGVQAGATLMVHSSWNAHNGFQGKPADVAAALKRVVGENGLLVMPSLPYQNMSSADYLAKGKAMDVRRTPSMMGMLSESFRRSAGVRRSLSPTHPLLAWGRDADAFLAGHELTDEPFGPTSPFGRLPQRDAFILGFDAPFSTFTFTHYVEAVTAHALPFPFYAPQSLPAQVINYDGSRIECAVKVIDAVANRARREERLIAELDSRALMRRAKIGHTSLLLVKARDVVAAAESLIARGQHFFDPVQA